MPTPITPRASERSPDTIVLVHGFWVTPRSWEHWIPYYEAKGYRVIAPAYPGFEVEVEALNADPTPIERLTVPAIIEHLESIIRELDAPPILMGHSAGGTFVQVLLDRGLGAVGVTFNSAPTEGVLVTPWSQIRASFPVLKSPANRHRAIGLNYDQWRYTFTTPSPRRRRVPRTSAITCPRRAASSGTACSRTSSPGTRRPGSITATRRGHRCCSSPAVRIT